MRFRDPNNGYSWLSIALHWATAIIILTLWFIGSSINADRANGSLATLNLHTSIAISAYLLLWARIIWRFWYKHPGPDAGAEAGCSTRSASTRTTRSSRPSAPCWCLDR